MRSSISEQLKTAVYRRHEEDDESSAARVTPRGEHVRCVIFIFWVWKLWHHYFWVLGFLFPLYFFFCSFLSYVHLVSLLI